MKAFISQSIFIVAVILPLWGNGQLATVTGKILNNLTGEVIQQVSVIDQNSGIGTISSGNGTFSLYLKSGIVELDFIDGGFQKFSTSFELKSDTVLQVLMQPVPLEQGKKNKREVTRDEILTSLAEKVRKRQ